MPELSCLESRLISELQGAPGSRDHQASPSSLFGYQNTTDNNAETTEGQDTTFLYIVDGYTVHIMFTLCTLRLHCAHYVYTVHIMFTLCTLRLHCAHYVYTVLIMLALYTLRHN